MESATSIDLIAENAKKFRALCRFRVLVRRVIANSKWLIERDDDSMIDLNNPKGHIIKLLFGNIVLEHGLTLKDKSLLCKSSLWRTDDEKYYLYKKIGDLNFFKLYPIPIIKELAARTYFTYIQKGRVILREGHLINSLYFILSGEVDVFQKMYDKLNKIWYEEKISAQSSNEMIGEISLIYNVPITGTWITKTDCELLYIKKEDFNIILRPTICKEWDEVKRIMSRFIYFSSLSEENIREGCLLGKIKIFQSNETIIGDGDGFINYVYFVIEGKCRLIENIRISTRNTANKNIFTLQELENSFVDENIIDVKDCTIHSETIDEMEYLKGYKLIDKSNTMIHPSLPKIQTQKSNNTQIISMQVCLISEGGCFNLGESLLNRRIVAINSVKCLLLPKSWLWRKDTAHIWTRVQHYMIKRIPSTETIFEQFVLNRRWNEYKMKILNNII